jgi:hypothetical protein
LDDGDLALIEINTTNPLVLKLVERVRGLEHEVDCLRETVSILEDENEELRRSTP